MLKQAQYLEDPVQTCQRRAVWGPSPPAFIHDQTVPLTWMINQFQYYWERPVQTCQRRAVLGTQPIAVGLRTDGPFDLGAQSKFNIWKVQLKRVSGGGSLRTQSTSVRSRLGAQPKFNYSLGKVQPSSCSIKVQYFEGPVQTCQRRAVWGPSPQAFVHDQTVPLTGVLNQSSLF